MAVDLETIGQRVGPFEHAYAWRDVALYALTVGASADEDLGYLLDDPAPKVLPTFGVIAAGPPTFEAMRRAGVDPDHVVHLGHRTEVFGPIASEGLMRTSAVIQGIWDMGIGALMAVDTQSEVDERVCCRTSWQLLVRKEGRFGGPRPPASFRVSPPAGAAPCFEHTVETSRSQALLYRLHGDLGRIHADPQAAREAGFERPILHGLCTYGIAARVALKFLAGDDPARFRAFEARFTRPVMPGDTLIVRGYDLPAPGQAAITVSACSTREHVISNALFEYTPAH